MTDIILYGYGNLGRAMHQALERCADLRLIGICSRRADRLREEAKQIAALWTPEQLWAELPKADVIINCGGSRNDLPHTTPDLARHWCVVDSFDAHAAIPAHCAAVNAAAQAAGTLCIVSAGWDPGLFSLMRVLFSAFLPGGSCCSFWGPGVSQGHSEALRRLPGVADARQYTVPDPAAIRAAARGAAPQPHTQTHRRVCYVVPEKDADIDLLTQTIRTMPDYFAGYEVEVQYISAEELAANHTGLPHGGSVICTDSCDAGTQSAQLQLSLASNPDFTAGILTAAARAAARLHRAGQHGCLTMAEIAPAMYAPDDIASLQKKYM